MMRVGTASDGGSYETARAKLEQMQDREEPHGFLEHVLPHQSDSGMLKAIKYGVGAAGALALGGGALLGGGRLFGSAALSGAGSGVLSLATIVGAGAGLVTVAGGLTGTLGSFNYSREVDAQANLVRELWEQTPDARERLDTVADVAAELMQPYDHDQDGAIDIGPHQRMAGDERIHLHGDETIDDADASVMTALPTLEQVDVDGDQSVSAAELEAWVGETFDTNGNGIVSTADRSGQEVDLPRDHYDDYRDFAAADH